MNTLGDLIMAGLIIAAVAIVPYKIAKAWLWPIVRPAFVSLFSGPTVNHSGDRAPVVMSRSEKAPPETSDMRAVSIPVPDTSINADTPWQMPRVSAYLSENELTVLLARQKKKDGKHRFSANEIFTIMGGNRNEVLKLVREVRETPEYAPIDAERQPLLN